MSTAEEYSGLVESFKAEVYTRTHIETIKRNFLYKHTGSIPGFVLHDPKNDEALIETLNTLRFEYPNNYMLDINHVTGTLTSRRDIDMIPFNLLNINVYGETTNDESFFMPTRFSTAKYYNYHLYTSFPENDRTCYIIYYTPIYENTKLLRGYFIVESGTWRIKFFRGEGLAILSNFSFEITMGNEWVTNYLPQDFTIHQRVSYLGNIIENRHLARITYKDITLRQPSEPYRSLNISDFYRIRLDSVPVYSDSVFWNERRPILLEDREKTIMHRFRERQQEKLQQGMAQADSISGTQRMTQFAQRMVMNSNYRLKSTKIGYSGLLNPTMLSYSTYNGLIYRQKISLNIDLYRGRQTLNTKTSAGYMFKYKEFFSDITTTWNYNPSRLRSLTLSLGNGNPTYSSLFIQQVQDSLKQSGLTFDDIALPYYRDYYIRLFNTHEITNGLLLSTGASYHFRVGRNKEVSLRTSASEETSDNIDNLFGTRRDFMPFIRVSWTPQQYYRYEGRQKIYVRSRYPTFKVEVARSLENILGGMSDYGRIEFDINHNIPFGLMQSFKYHVGVGTFINQKTEYFADFFYFQRSNFPESWHDGVGGVFNLLGRSLYNASDSYVQAHLMYETPFFILKSIPFITNFADKERIYVSQLYTPQIVSYTELGYGIGNRFFNAAVFGAFHRTEFRRIGARVVFEM
jgi:hypothetical protein